MRVTVLVKPGSKKGPLVQANLDGSLTVYLAQRAVEGMANQALIEILAEHFKAPKTKISIESGFKSRIKRISVDI